MKRSVAIALSVLASSVALVAAQGGSATTAKPAAKPATKAAASTKPLEIYVADVEGGKAALWVTPSGQSLLIDTGSPGGRDRDRVVEMMAAAGVTKIDFLLLTHYHVDHVGGLKELVAAIPPISHFYDHGPTVEDGVDGHQREQVPDFQVWYADLNGKAQHTVLKPGDRIPLTGVDWRIVTAAGKVIKTPLPGGGKPNPACAGVTRQDVPRDPENAQSVGSVISYGGFRALDFGDLTQDVEYDLMCPNNPIGTVDMYFVSNHGINSASSPEFVHGIQPRVAIVQNSAGKGGSKEMFESLRTSPGFDDVWQLHWSNAGGADWNSPGVFIANGVDPQAIATSLTAPPRAAGAGRGGPGGPGGPGGGPRAGGGPGAGAPAAGAPSAGAPGAAGGPVGPVAGNAAAPAAGGPGQAPQPGGAPGAPGAPGGGRAGGGRGGFGAAGHTPAYAIKISVQADGTYTVTNTRNDFSKTYQPEHAAATTAKAAPKAATAPAAKTTK